jgi:hypothetical protein
LLISHRVRFVIVGAHALAALGRPRNTLDLDVFVEPTLRNAQRFAAAAEAYGLSGLAEVAAELARGAKMTRIGDPPLRIDVMNPIDGVSFAAAWSGRRRARIDGLLVAFLGETELRSAGSPFRTDRSRPRDPGLAGRSGRPALSRATWNLLRLLSRRHRSFGERGSSSRSPARRDSSARTSSRGCEERSTSSV